MGFVAVSKDCEFFFYELDPESHQVRLVRDWTLQVPEFLLQSLSMNDLLNAMSILDVKTELITLFISFKNCNAITLNLWEEVYSPEKKEELAIKLNQHENIM